MIISNKMKTRISYYILISPSYYVDISTRNSIWRSLCSFVGYDVRYSVSVNVNATNTNGNFEWIVETLLRDCVRDYFEQNER